MGLGERIPASHSAHPCHGPANEDAQDQGDQSAPVPQWKEETNAQSSPRTDNNGEIYIHFLPFQASVISYHISVTPDKGPVTTPAFSIEAPIIPLGKAVAVA